MKPWFKACAPLRNSLALRMGLLYGLSTLVMILAATAFMYLGFTSHLARQDTRYSSGELSNVRMILAPAGSTRSEVPAVGPSDDDREIYLRLLDPQGHILSETPGMASVAPAPTHAALSRIRTPEGAWSYARDRHGHAYRSLLAPRAANGSRESGFIQIATNQSDEAELLSHFRFLLTVVTLVSIAATGLLGYMVACAGLRPVRQIGASAERIGSANIHERIETDPLPAELSSLVGAFNKMLDRLEESFTRVSRFSDDVAHELRTPINNLRGEIEVTLTRERPSEDYRRVLASCLEECDRISGIVQSLLFLARADGGLDPLQRDAVDVAQELQTMGEFYGPAAQEKGVVLTVAAAPRLAARLNRSLFQQAVGNLLSNAIHYTPSGGRIRLEARREDEALRVVVSDTGCGVAAEHLPHVFERFYRADRARAGTEHVGLGLAVVRGILDLHGGRARMESTLNQGAQVELTFPQST